MSTVGDRWESPVAQANAPEKREPADPAERDGPDEHDGKIQGIHWLAYAALVGIPTGLITADSTDLPGPDWMWEAIVVLAVSVALLAWRVAKNRRRGGGDPRIEFRDQVQDADASIGRPKSLPRGTDREP
jgi:hypothetical protein